MIRHLQSSFCLEIWYPKPRFTLDQNPCSRYQYDPHQNTIIATPNIIPIRIPTFVQNHDSRGQQSLWIRIFIHTPRFHFHKNPNMSMPKVMFTRIPLPCYQLTTLIRILIHVQSIILISWARFELWTHSWPRLLRLPWILTPWLQHHSSASWE